MLGLIFSDFTPVRIPLKCPDQSETSPLLCPRPCSQDIDSMHGLFSHPQQNSWLPCYCRAAHGCVEGPPYTGAAAQVGS